jgi:alpha-beta hydrolase superfamily lysophospholipase
LAAGPRIGRFALSGLWEKPSDEHEAGHDQCRFEHLLFSSRGPAASKKRFCSETVQLRQENSTRKIRTFRDSLWRVSRFVFRRDARGRNEALPCCGDVVDTSTRYFAHLKMNVMQTGKPSSAAALTPSRVLEAASSGTFGVVTTESSFPGARGVTIYRRAWTPAGRARGVMVLVHGMSEHSGRYDHVGRFLASRGLAVHALDHRGHGRSGGETGTVEEFGFFLDDLATFMKLVRAEVPGGPIVLLGHSMGGLIVSAYLLERKPSPDLVILSGPAIVPIVEPGERRIDATRLSRDPEAQRAYMEDPLVLRERVKEELFYRLAEGVGLLVGRATEIHQPLLLIHGTDDRLCSAEGAEMWVRSSSSPDLTVHLYPEGRHEMFNETNRDEVLEGLWTWLDQRLPA